MIVGYHLIVSAYGFWLPNDPRGSWSEFVGAWDLFRAGGRAMRDQVTERRSYAADPHDLWLESDAEPSAVWFRGAAIKRA